jgi:hypothetical protein
MRQTYVANANGAAAANSSSERDMVVDSKGRQRQNEAVLLSNAECNGTEISIDFRVRVFRADQLNMTFR